MMQKTGCQGLKDDLTKLLDNSHQVLQNAIELYNSSVRFPQNGGICLSEKDFDKYSAILASIANFKKAVDGICRKYQIGYNMPEFEVLDLAFKPRDYQGCIRPYVTGTRKI